MRTIFVTGSAKVIMPEQGTCKASNLLSILQLSNFELTFDAKSQYLLAIDHNKSAYKNFISGGGTPERAFLLRLEPPSVFPAQYRQSIEKRYGTIFTPGSIIQKSEDFVGWPYQIHADPNSPAESRVRIEGLRLPSQIDYKAWANREIFLTMVAANKVSPALGRGYALRRKFARSLKTSDFHLFGLLWHDSLRLKLRHRLAVSYFAIRQGTMPNLASIYGDLFFKYPRSLGAVEDKHMVLKNSKFSLVIENSDTYVSEKLFDSLINGSIPIYFGPKLGDARLPDGIAIQYGGPPDKIVDFLSGMSEIDIQHKLQAMSRFLNSDNFKNDWFEANVYENIASLIKTKICGG